MAASSNLTQRGKDKNEERRKKLNAETRRKRIYRKGAKNAKNQRKELTQRRGGAEKREERRDQAIGGFSESKSANILAILKIRVQSFLNPSRICALLLFFSSSLLLFAFFAALHLCVESFLSPLRLCLSAPLR
jgi:hypothetical protein